MASQISQLVNAISRLNTQYGKLPSESVSNVHNVSAIFTVCCMESFPTPVPELVIEVVEAVDSDEKMVCLSERCEVCFDSPLKSDSYMPISPFP